MASASEVLSLFEKGLSNATFATSCADGTKIPFDLENKSRPLDAHSVVPVVLLDCLQHLLFMLL